MFDSEKESIRIRIVFPNKRRILNAEEKDFFRIKALKELENIQKIKVGEPIDITPSFIHYSKCLCENYSKRDIEKSLDKNELIMTKSIKFLINNNQFRVKDLINESMFERIDLSIRALMYLSSKEKMVDMFVRSSHKGRKKFCLGKKESSDGSVKERIQFLFIVTHLIYTSSSMENF